MPLKVSRFHACENACVRACTCTCRCRSAMCVSVCLVKKRMFGISPPLALFLVCNSTVNKIKPRTCASSRASVWNSGCNAPILLSLDPSQFHWHDDNRAEEVEDESATTLAPGCGQHLNWLEPEQCPFKSDAPSQPWVSVLMHSPTFPVTSQVILF